MAKNDENVNSQAQPEVQSKQRVVTSEMSSYLEEFDRDNIGLMQRAGGRASLYQNDIFNILIDVKPTPDAVVTKTKDAEGKEVENKNPYINIPTSKGLISFRHLASLGCGPSTKKLYEKAQTNSIKVIRRIEGYVQPRNGRDGFPTLSFELKWIPYQTEEQINANQG